MDNNYTGYSESWSAHAQFYYLLTFWTFALLDLRLDTCVMGCLVVRCEMPLSGSSLSFSEPCCSSLQAQSGTDSSGVTGVPSIFYKLHPLSAMWSDLACKHKVAPPQGKRRACGRGSTQTPSKSHQSREQASFLYEKLIVSKKEHFLLGHHVLKRFCVHSRLQQLQRGWSLSFKSLFGA